MRPTAAMSAAPKHPAMTSRLPPSTLRWRAVAALCAAAALAGCAVGPDFVRPDSGLSAAASHPPQDTVGVPTSAEVVPSQWWTLFNDSVLTDLQARAQAGNLDLRIASERIEQSRAQLGIASSQLLPSVSANAGYAREALSAHGKFAALGAPTRPGDFWQIGIDAAWEIDLWGRARREREGAAAALEATVYEREAARVALSAEVARRYLQLRGTQALLDVAQQNVVVAERTLGLAESRERNGVATRYEITTARAQVATIKALIPNLHRQRQAHLNALALLLGDRPRALDAQLRDAMPLPLLPASVPIGIPSELARRRPDILRAEAQLHAATADIGVAKADFYPRVGLRGRLGLEAFEFDDLDSWDSRFFSVGPTVHLPIFQGGRLTQRLALTEARQKTVAIAYRQTVLRAWHEVDDALDAWGAQQRQHAELLTSYEQNQESLRVAERGYQEGASDYLSVLTAQRNVLASQASLSTSATNVTLALVNLYRALGGGWNPQELEADAHAVNTSGAEPTRTTPRVSDATRKSRQ